MRVHITYSSMLDSLMEDVRTSDACSRWLAVTAWQEFITRFLHASATGLVFFSQMPTHSYASCVQSDFGFENFSLFSLNCSIFESNSGFKLIPLPSFSHAFLRLQSSFALLLLF
jgi:hypothetical protein